MTRCAFLMLVCVITSGLVQFSVNSANAGHEHKEKYYQDKWCSEHNGQAEVVFRQIGV